MPDDQAERILRKLGDVERKLKNTIWQQGGVEAVHQIEEAVADEIQLEEWQRQWEPPASPEEIAEEMRKADALIERLNKKQKLDSNERNC